MTGTGMKGALARASGAMVLAVAMLAVAGCGEVYSHGDFNTMVVSKSPEEVSAKLGKPDEIDSSDPAHVTWTYKRRTFDLEHQNSIDSKALVIFDRKRPDDALRVTDVKFSS